MVTSPFGVAVLSVPVMQQSPGAIIGRASSQGYLEERPVEVDEKGIKK